MPILTRRSIIQSSLGLAAAGTLARPYIANAQAKTAEVWFAQGFAEEEDIALKKLVAEYEKTSGNKIDLSIVPFAPPSTSRLLASLNSLVLEALCLIMQRLWRISRFPASRSRLNGREDR